MLTPRPVAWVPAALATILLSGCVHAQIASRLPGTATVRGRVYDRETGRPLPHAVVRAVFREQGQFRVTTADTQGRYELPDLPAGHYYLTASDEHYIMTSYDQKIRTDSPKLLDVQSGQTLEKVDLRLSRAGVIAGRVVDEYGDPVPNVLVGAKRFRFSSGERELRLAGSGPQLTDDKGEYRIFDLAPEEYFVSTDIRRGTASATAGDKGYANTFFPSTTSVADAQRVTIGVGSTIERVNITLIPARLASISGTVVNSAGQLLSDGSVFASERTRASMTSPRGAIRPDGTFTLSGVAPGEYILHANMPGVQQSETDGRAILAVSIAGRDVSGIRLAFVQPSTASGRIIVDRTAIPALRQSYTGVTMNSTEPQGTWHAPGLVNADLSFAVKVSPGRHVVRLTDNSSGWFLKSVRFNGADVTDTAIHVRPNEDLVDIEVELTNRATVLSGTVTDDRGATPSSYTVVVFARDHKQWARFSRYVATTGRNADGRFTISGLPPGEYYAAAINGSRPDQARDEEFLAQIYGAAVTFLLTDGETKTLDLKLSAR